MRFLRFSAVLLMVLAVFAVQSQTAICSYKYRKRITFDPSKVGGSNDLTNFTALISITTDNDLRTVANSGHVENANGYDIVFTSSDGATRLDHQLEKYTATTGELVTWVRIPTLSKTLNTTIYMYYGNTAISTDQSSTSAWSSSYKGVWHLHNNVLTDGTSSGNNGTNSGSTNFATAKIGGGRAFSGAGGNYLQLGSSGANGGNGNGSVSLWGRITSAAASTYFIGETTTQTGAYANRLQLYIGDNSGTLYLGLGGSHTILNNVQVLSLNTWYHIALTWSNTGVGVGNYSVYVNGTQKGSGTYSSWTALHTFMDAGNDGNAGQRTEEIPGNIDEVHLTNTTLNTAWFLTEYNNQNSPSTFYSISAEPKVWIGGTNTNFNAASNWLNNSAAGSNDDVIISNGINQPMLQGGLQLTSLYIKTGAALSLDANNLSVRGDITSCGALYGNTGMLTLNNNSATWQTQYLSGSGTYSLFNLTINNSYATAPAVVLNQNVGVSGALALTSGILYSTSSAILALDATATSGSGSSGSFVSGPMSKAGTTDFVFPLGKGTRWRRAGISNLGAGGTYSAEYFSSAYASTSPVTAPLWRVSSVEYWQIDQLSGTPNANVTLYWENANSSGINSCADLSIARWSGSSWDERDATIVTGSSCSGTGVGSIITNAAVTAFSPFTFASKAGNLNPLPVELKKQSVECKADGIHVSFSTLTELNCKSYLLSNGRDAENWTAIETLNCRNRPDGTKYYEFGAVASDKAADAYFRISEIDFDGTSRDFPLMYASCVTGLPWMIYPNPGSGTFVLKANSAVSGVAKLQITDNSGRLVYENELIFTPGSQEISLSVDLADGLYSCCIVADGDQKRNCFLLNILH